MSHAHTSDAGSTLIEVLVAIFVMGVGLLALLTLFPLGALEMAQAIPDDRTATIAADARQLSDTGRDLLCRTAKFAEESLTNGAVDPAAAARLQQEYSDLAAQAEALEAQLEELRWVFPPEEIQRHAGPLLAQLQAIRQTTAALIVLLSLVD
jgi:Tfp pilus assembly protein PilV